MSEKLTVRNAKEFSRKLENCTLFLGTVCISVHFSGTMLKNLTGNWRNYIRNCELCVKACNFFSHFDRPVMTKTNGVTLLRRFQKVLLLVFSKLLFL